jgi:phosphoserine phosphatase
MRYLALAADYDDTLATSGKLSPGVEAALARLRQSGRRVVLLTGRTFEELVSVCPKLEQFDFIVLENGAVTHSPSTRTTSVLCRPVAPELTLHLARRGVEPLIEGRAIVATRRPHEIAVLETVRDLDLDLHIGFNGAAITILPSGVNKGTGLTAALREIGLSVHEVVGVGNAANDHSFLELCECAVAVDNAVAAIKERADFCTRGAAGSGVEELIDELVSTDLSKRAPGGAGEAVVLALREDGSETTFPPYGHNIFISGPSGAGKSTFATGLIERLMARRYQLCIIDPEGDYSTLDEIITVGSRVRAAQMDEIFERLRDPEANVVINLLGFPLQERPDFFAQLFPRLQAMRARTGRPHWIVIDEVHHLLPANWGLAPATLPQRLGETVLISHRPREVAPAILSLVDTAVAVGPGPEGTFAEFAAALRIDPPAFPGQFEPRRGTAVIWQRTAATDPFVAKVIPARSERLRHLRKYAEGNLGHRSFFFRGPGHRMNLKAQNLVAFCQLAEGVDEDTWLHHLRERDYSAWLGRVIKDEDLAREVAAIEQASHLASTESRRMVCDAIDRRYMLSA